MMDEGGALKLVLGSPTKCYRRLRFFPRESHTVFPCRPFGISIRPDCPKGNKHPVLLGVFQHKTTSIKPIFQSYYPYLIVGPDSSTTLSSSFGPFAEFPFLLENGAKVCLLPISLGSFTKLSNPNLISSTIHAASPKDRLE